MSFKDDNFILLDTLRLKKIFDYDIIVETGTYRGDSLRILKTIFKKVYTCEVSKELYNEVQAETGLVDENVIHILGNSPDCLKEWFKEINHDKFYLYLDAHWDSYWPLLDELEQVIDFKYKPVIIIHDFDTENGFAYDTWGNHPLNWDYVKDKITKIYGEDGFKTYYNLESGINRGCAYFYPKNI